jgi:hypothetical protein
VSCSNKNGKTTTRGKKMTTVAEHKLNIIQQIVELPEESLIELEKIIIRLKFPIEKFSDNKKVYQGKKIRAILEEGSKAGVFLNIGNPAQWQKEIRKDRHLPGRD